VPVNSIKHPASIDLQVNSCRTKEVFLEETLLKKGFTTGHFLFLRLLGIIGGRCFVSA
jgi:hypothetical protein